MESNNIRKGKGLVRNGKKHQVSGWLEMQTCDCETQVNIRDKGRKKLHCI